LVLGEDHPLSRAIMWAHALTRQVAATATMVALGVLAIAEGRAWGPRLLGAALLVELTLVGIFAFVRESQREHVLRLIASNRSQLPLEEVSREARRLANPRHAAELAGRLERVFDDAMGWHRLAVTSRPPPGIRLLCEFASEVDAIVSRLRDGEAALPGLALLELMLCGAYESALYSGDRNALREQLWRVRHLLSRPELEKVDEHAPG
jgi:hypothetical protein